MSPLVGRCGCNDLLAGLYPQPAQPAPRPSSILLMVSTGPTTFLQGPEIYLASDGLQVVRRMPPEGKQ